MTSFSNFKSQLVSASTSAAGIELGGGGVTAYATPSDLPLVGNEAGDQAFVSSTNRLYIFNGSGWFNVALVNTSPTITQGSEASYQLQKNGTPIVITLAATDPEETPIIWSYVVTSGAVGNTATVTQVDNVFTITPSTDENDGGEFTLTFTASDGVNVDTSTSVFSLSFGWELDVTELDGNYVSRISYTNNWNAYGITHSSNGLHTYIVGGGTSSSMSHRIYQFTSTNDQQIDDDSRREASVYPNGLQSAKIDCYISNDGVYFYWISDPDKFQRFTLTTPFDIQSIDPSSGVTGSTLNRTNSEWIAHYFTLSDNGQKLYTLKNYLSNQIIEYTLPSPFEIGDGTATRVAAYNLPSAYGAQYQGIAIDPAGINIYIMNMESKFTLHIIQYSMSIPYSIATASEVGRKTYTGSNPFGNAYSVNMAINAGNIVVVSNDAKPIVQFT